MCRKSIGMKLQLLFLALFLSGIHFIDSFTDPQDVAVLNALKAAWKNTPSSWGHSDQDPCGSTSWEGVTCNNSRVTALKLSTMGLEGKIEGDIGGLTELRSLDLSFNRGLTGSLSPQLGDLKKLNFLILAGCGFSGDIPDELGNLSELLFLALNKNNLTGKIPPSFGNFSKQFYWLDLAENMLTGPVPVSTSMGAPGLDLLLKARHFHFNKNKLSGPIPAKLFSSNMSLIHILFDGNQLSGSIPPTLGLVKTLEVLRLDRNALTGSVPDLSNLTNIVELNLAQNKLTGALPDLTQMMKLNYLDLSNNSFDPSEAPKWFSTLSSLTTLVMENGSLQGSIPQELFSLPQLQQVKLRNNKFSDTLDMGLHEKISPQLELVDLQNNDISRVMVGSKYHKSLILKGNPVCNEDTYTNYCQQNHDQPTKSYSTNSQANCESTSCPPDQDCNPRNCECAYPYKGTLYVGGSLFSELSKETVFNLLEYNLCVNLSLLPGSVSILSTGFNFDNHLHQVQLAFFPSTGKYFNRSEIQRIGFLMTTQQYSLPAQPFGAFCFIADPYDFTAKYGGPSTGTRVIIKIAITCCAILVLGLLGVGIYAVRQKRRAEEAIGFSNPFASWKSSGNDSSGAAPKLKVARLFSYDELRKCTNNFAERNEIGSGAYGKVYKGLLSDGLVVAIKRAQQGSTQGLLGFKTEIEMLSRVHHKNLVGLVGFCFEQGEQMLVYEFMPNGTIRDSLSGKSGVYLDWNRRLHVALGSARGLAYLHELANPPIIHRDVKSTNILLDEDLTAKVADFGLSKLVSDALNGHVSTQVKGTMGYLDPEYYQTQQLTEKSDVYSFGVFMLELLTSKRPIEMGKYIVRQVRTTMNKDDEEHYGLWDMIDSSIRDTNNLIGFGQILEITMQCIEDSPEDRPTMSEVVKAFETILQNNGMASSTYALSSTSDLGASRGASKHPYNDPTHKMDVSSIDTFGYSGAYIVSTRVEPK